MSEPEFAAGITVEIISQDGCPNCEIAKEKLAKAGYKYVEIDYETIASRSDRADLMASLVISGVDINHPENVALPIMRVLSHDWSNNTSEILSQAHEAAEKFAAAHPEYAKTIEAVANGTTGKQFPAPNRVTAPENKEWREERIKLIAKDALQNATAAKTDADPAQALDDLYLAMRQNVKSGGFSMGDFRNFVETAYKCMAKQQAMARDEQLAQSTSQAFSAIFGGNAPKKPEQGHGKDNGKYLGR